jgi:hypothetical protein
MKRLLRALGLGVGIAVLSAVAFAAPASADEVFIGFAPGSPTSVGSSFFNSGIDATGTVSESGFTVSVTGTTSGNGSGLDSNAIVLLAGGSSISIFVSTEPDNPFSTPISTYVSGFTSNFIPSGWSVTESTYAFQCSSLCISPVPPTTLSGPSANQLAAATFSGTSSLTSTNLVPGGSLSGNVAGSFELTEVFTITANTPSTEAANLSIDLTAITPTPLPAALPLFAAGLGAMGFAGWRRKRKAA